MEVGAVPQIGHGGMSESVMDKACDILHYQNKPLCTLCFNLSAGSRCTKNYIGIVLGHVGIYRDYVGMRLG